MKKLVIFLGVLLLLAVSGLTFYKSSMTHAKYPLKTSIENCKVEAKDTLYTVLGRLEAQGKIYNVKFIKLYIKQNKLNTSIKPGEYNLQKEDTIEVIISKLNKGAKDKDVVEVTIPEGFNIEQIGERLEEKGIISKANFISSAKEYKLPDYIKVDSKRRYALEGYLFPDTYELKKDMKGKDIIDVMIKEFESVISDIEKSKGITVDRKKMDELIIMASIVEKEIETGPERGKAASVFYNRLKIGMKLQSCATVLYAEGIHKGKVLNKDLEFPSPYNTYIVPALPVGPICSPGRECILASITPEKTNYLYFVSKNDGTHFFTDNYQDHLKAVAKYQGN